MDSATRPLNRIQVSNVKKPLFFYVNLAKVGGECLCGGAEEAVSR